MAPALNALLKSTNDILTESSCVQPACLESPVLQATL